MIKLLARILILLCLVGTIFGEIEKVDLENGLTLFLRPTKSESIKATVLVNAGSNNEKEDEKGVAHFLEHILAAEQKRHGFVNLYAYTTAKYTCYQFYLKLYDEEVVADTLGTFISDFMVEKDGLERQRKIILKEREESNIQTAEGSEIIGERKDIEKISANLLMQFYYQHYHAENIAFIVEGNFSKELMIEAFEKRFHTCRYEKEFSEEEADGGMCFRKQNDLIYFRTLFMNNEQDFKKWIAVQFFSQILHEKLFNNEWLQRCKINELGISTQRLFSPIFFIGCTIDQDFIAIANDLLHEIEYNYLSEGDSKHYEELFKKVIKKEVFKYLNPSWNGENIQTVCLDAFLFGDQRYKLVENKDLMKKVLKKLTYKKVLQEIHEWLQADVEYVDFDKDQVTLNDEKKVIKNLSHKTEKLNKPPSKKDAFSIEKIKKNSNIICMQGKNGSKLYLQNKKVPYVTICAKKYLPMSFQQLGNQEFLSFYCNTLSKLFSQKYWDLEIQYSENMLYLRSFVEKNELYHFFDFLNASFQKDSQIFELIDKLYKKTMDPKEKENSLKTFETVFSEYGKWYWFVSGDLKPKDFFYDLPFFVENRKLESIRIDERSDDKQIEKQGKLDHLTLYRYSIEIPKHSLITLNDYLNFNIFVKYLKDRFYHILRRNDQFSYTIFSKLIKSNDDLFLQYYFYLDKKQSKSITFLVDQFNEILYPQLFDFAFYEYKEKLLTQYRFEINERKNYERHFFIPLDVMHSYSESDLLNQLELLEYDAFIKFCDKMLIKT